MKQISFLFLAILYFSSCKKDTSVQLRFTIAPADNTYTIKWDSIAYTSLCYSDITELDTPEKLNNPEIFSHAVTIDILKDALTLNAGSVIVIKKFEIIGKTGQILYYIPYTGQPGSQVLHENLPLTIVLNSSMSRYMNVARSH